MKVKDGLGWIKMTGHAVLCVFPLGETGGGGGQTSARGWVESSILHNNSREDYSMFLSFIVVNTDWEGYVVIPADEKYNRE